MYSLTCDNDDVTGVRGECGVGCGSAGVLASILPDLPVRDNDGVAGSDVLGVDRVRVCETGENVC